ncbi:MAG: DUF1015 family protein [Gemmatimonadota bacterium]
MGPVEPFHGVRYGPAAGDPESLLAPPYDIIDAAAAERLRSSSPYNAVHLILPEGEGKERYERVAARFRAWLSDGILRPDPEPAVYLHRHTFVHEGRTRQRIGLFCAVRLTPFSEGRILPHEETHSGPKEDRLALTLACRAQLSAVLLLASDPDAALYELLDRAFRAGHGVLATGAAERERHELVQVASASLAKELCAAAGAAPLLIADGHHRYETALEVRSRLSQEPRARKVLACVVSEADPGLLLLPTHRSVRGSQIPGEWKQRLPSGFSVEPVPPPTRSDRAGCGRRYGETGADAAAARAHETGSPVLFCPGEGTAWRIRAPTGEGGPPLGEERIASLLFDRRILPSLLGCDVAEAVRRGVLSYHRDPAGASRAAGRQGLVGLLPAPKIWEVRHLAGRGRRLPPKTTYFTPKVPSGLVYRSLSRSFP